jgi:hypothetical protein
MTSRAAWSAFGIGVVAVTSLTFAAAQPPRPAAFVTRAATALGGDARLRAIKTITVAGYGEAAYMNGGGNISASPDAPQKWVSLPEYDKTIDLEHGRMRVRQRNHQNFVFAGLAGYLGAANPAVALLDGAVAYNLAANGRAVRAGDQAVRARRFDMLNNPVVLVRAALDTAARVTNVRAERTLQLGDITVATGETLTLAIDGASGLPAWVRWRSHDENLGDVTFRTSFTGYLPVKGVMLPMGYNTVIDFRGVVQNKLYVDKNAVDEPIDDLAAPADVRSAAPAPAPSPMVEATRVGQGVWLLHGNGGANSILFEFADHLTMFEAPSSQGWTKALIDRARATVPGKPLTELVVSHHHFDHTGGIRQAMAEGLTIIAHKGTEGLFREIAARPGTIAPDALGSTPRPLKFKAVDDHLRLATRRCRWTSTTSSRTATWRKGCSPTCPRTACWSRATSSTSGGSCTGGRRRMPTTSPIGSSKWTATSGARARRADRAGDAGHRADDQGGRGRLHPHAGGRRLYAWMSSEGACPRRGRAVSAVGS